MQLKTYFDLQSFNRTNPLQALDSKRHQPVLPQYLIVVLGIVVEPFLKIYRDIGVWDFSGFSGRVLFGLIIGIIILPGIYKATFDTTKPLSLQLAALFPLGIGWQGLFDSAVKLGSSITPTLPPA